MSFHKSVLRWLAVAGLAIVGLLAGLLAGCGGNGDDSAQVPVSSNPTTSIAAATSTTISSVVHELPDDLVDVQVPVAIAGLGVLRLDESLDPPDYVADDSYSRCDIYTAEMLTALLERRFSLVFEQPGLANATGACTWLGVTEDGGTAFVNVHLAKLSPEVLAGDERIDPTMGDGAGEVGDILRIYAWADPVWELDATTFGPGTAFRRDQVIGRINVAIPEALDLRQAAIDERQAELVLSQNLALRLE